MWNDGNFSIHKLPSRGVNASFGVVGGPHSSTEQIVEDQQYCSTEHREPISVGEIGGVVVQAELP
jgi:hypothetical protein